MTSKTHEQNQPRGGVRETKLHRKIEEPGSKT